MKTSICFFLCVLVMNGLASCNAPAQSGRDSAQGEIEQQYHSVSVLLTQTAQVVPGTITAVASPAMLVTASPLPASTNSDATPPAASTSTPEPEISANEAPQKQTPQGKALAAPCDLAQLGYPIDISVPDGSHFLPGEYFSKTWRLVNAGSCKWTPDYALVWFSGTNLGINPLQPLGSEVRWGSSVDVTVDMVAPSAPGTYQSNWKMRNPAGELFGIGPNGDAPFWVRIIVVPVDTPTVTPTVSDATPTPAIYASGSLALMVGEGIDLDSAQINQEVEDDLHLLDPESGEIQLMPATGVHLALFGAGQPQLFDCEQSDIATEPVIVEQNEVGMYLCYRTTQGLPGRLTIKSVDLENKQVNLEFTTWVVP